MSGPAPDARTRVLADVVRRDHPPCPACRRPLEELDATACPRCRTSLVLTLDPRGSGTGPWAFGVLAAAVGAGFYVLSAVVILPRLLRPGSGWSVVERISWATGLVLTVGLLLAWLLARRRVRRWPHAAITGAAIATLLFGLGSIVVLVLL